LRPHQSANARIWVPDFLGAIFFSPIARTEYSSTNGRLGSELAGCEVAKYGEALALFLKQGKEPPASSLLSTPSHGFSRRLKSVSERLAVSPAMLLAVSVERAARQS
jgi:hypothetical protein